MTAIWLLAFGLMLLSVHVASQCNTDVDPNLAQWQPATQSSTYPATSYSTNEAYLAVDNNANPSYPAGSCIHTNSETSPWWVVDLGQSSQVTAVSITNRGDCCGNRLNNFIVGVSDTYPPVLGQYPICYQYSGSVPLGATVCVQCAAGTPAGRYVIIQAPNLNDYMNFCEVQVFGQWTTASNPFPNLAFGQPATQSTTYGATYYSSNDAFLAVDGNADPNYSDGSCMCTDVETSPWWVVDLGSIVTVLAVNITNRGDCCGDRLNNFIVGVSNTYPPVLGQYPICDQYSGVVPLGATVLSFCQDGTPAGRYVIVQAPDLNDSMNFCEVQVFGVYGAIK